MSISTTISTGITLGTAASTGTYTSPLTITLAGVVDTGTGNAIYGPATNAWTIVNHGGITATGTGSVAIDLLAGGSVFNSRTITGYDSGIVFGTAGTVGTVSNTGTIITTGTNVTIGDGVYLGAGGSVSNTATAGLIEGYNNGVDINNAAGTVTNSGKIEGTGVVFSNGVELVDGGSVSNNTGGLIEGYAAGVFASGVGTVTNSGTITITGTSGDGIVLPSGSVNNTGLIEGYPGIAVETAAGVVSNSGTITGIGTGTAALGISLAAGGTVIDSGTISGGSGTAISFGGTGFNFLILEHGYQLTGGVYGTVAATNTLELGGTVSAAVTVGYTGLGLTNFQDVLFGAGGNDTLKVSNIGGTLPVTISGFTLTSDIVDLTAIGTDGTIASQSSTEVTVTGTLGSETLTLDASDTAQFTVRSDGATGTDLVACFCRDTRILTERGEVAVEDLAIGDRVITLSGAARPIKWIGRRAYDGRFIAANRAVLPICIEAGALGDGIPARDLWISPEHALHLDGLLVPAGLLVNGGTIRRIDSVDRLEYLHIELGAHDVILAEGAPAETFVDCDNRLMFQNGEEFARLYPDDQPEPWEFCAPRLEPGSAELPAIRAVLLERAEALGHTLESDPDLHLVVDGRAIWPESIAGDRYRFVVPAGGRTVWLASRSAVPAETAAGPSDLRRLGVALNRIALRDSNHSIEASHGDAMLCEGFHENEAGHRWTDGLARIPEAWIRVFAGSFILEVHIGQTGLGYRFDPPPPHARARAA